MSDDLAALSDFGGVARLFPLPNLVLFPHVMQPLHIFEARYREMTADALAGDRLIAMALLQDGTENDYEGKPALHPVACLGKVVADHLLDDGRYHLLLRGLNRVRILSEVPGDTQYRRAEVALLTDIEVQGALGQHLRRRLVKAVSAWIADKAGVPELLDKALKSEVSLGALTDILSFALPLRPEVKLRQLEEVQVERRVACLMEYLSAGDAPVDTTERIFPPGFSVN